MDDLKLLQTRVPEDVFEKVQRLAKSSGLSPAAWMRRLLTLETSGESEAIVEAIDKQLRYAPDGCLKAMARARDFLRRLP